MVAINWNSSLWSDTIIILFYWFLRDNQKELMPGMNYSVDDQ